MKSVKSRFLAVTLLAFVVLGTFLIQSNSALTTQQEEKTIRQSITLGKDNTGAYIQPLDDNKSIRINASSTKIGIFIGSRNGYVGVGTQSPQRILDVEGSFRAGTAEIGGNVTVGGEVTAKKFNTGDIIFRLEGKETWRMYEKQDGLYLQSIETGETSKIFLEKDLKPLQDELRELRKDIEKIKTQKL